MYRMITEVIGKEFMQVPQSEEQWLRVREKFYERWNFSNCLGAIDGKHIVIASARQVRVTLL